MDIKSASAVSNQPIVSSGQAGSQESSVNARQNAVDSVSERKEIERSETGPGVGEGVDERA